MRTKLHLLLTFSVVMLFFGCATSQSDKLPAGDIDIYTKYKEEIAILHNSSLRPNSKIKYDAALTLYENIDFSFVREIFTLQKIFSAYDAHETRPKNGKRTIIYLYRYKNKRVRFVFERYNNAITHSECTDITE